MVRQATNELLQKAKKSKSDEFYTQFCDIERELQHYPDCFHEKVVYCNCDDARVSNFYRYFKKNFDTLGLKALIASCYIGILGSDSLIRDLIELILKLCRSCNAHSAFA